MKHGGAFRGSLTRRWGRFFSNIAVFAERRGVLHDLLKKVLRQLFWHESDEGNPLVGILIDLETPIAS